MKNHLTLPALILVVFFLSGFSGNQVSTENRAGSIIVNCLSRTYIIHLPVLAKTMMPLVIVLHGGGGNGKGMVKLTIYLPSDFC